MTKSGYREAVVEYIREQAKPLDKFSHQPRLYRLAKRLAEDKPFDDEVLFAGAWMHDLGVFVGHRPEEPQKLAAWDHVAYVMRRAPEILKQLGFPEAKIPAVMEVVRTHLPAAQPASFEGVLLRDADLLEQLGSVGALRTIAKIGRDTRFVTFSDALRLLRRNVDQLPAQLRLDSARQLAEARVKTLQSQVRIATGEDNGGKPKGATLEELQNAIPASPALSTFLRQADGIRTASGVKVQSIVPTPPTAAAGVSSI
jgi:uncharacterized protein